MYVSVIFPLAIPNLYTYHVPEDFRPMIKIGVRVEVALRNKQYAAIVCKISEWPSEGTKPKDILSIIDDESIISDIHLRFWQWVAEYYCCTLGEVMQCALPSGLKLESETKIVLGTTDYGDVELSDDSYLVAEALSVRKELTIEEIKSILNKKSVYLTIRNLLSEGILVMEEELIEKYAEKKIKVCALSSTLDSEEKQIEALDQTTRSEAQQRILLYLIQYGKDGQHFPCTALYEKLGVNLSQIRALEKKGYLFVHDEVVSRLEQFEKTIYKLPDLSEEQNQAIDCIEQYFDEGKTVLLHGVTGSGKTRIYLELIGKEIEKGNSVLYLLPEIALTSQMVGRLKDIIGDKLLVYHSRMSNAERVEIWNKVKSEQYMVLGARSSVFLPFNKLGLIIVDEEHDSSYKQQDPAPRYNGRDTVAVMKQLWQSKVILGSATPSLESIKNVLDQKYGLVVLKERYGQVSLPSIELIDMVEQKKSKGVDGNFSFKMLKAIRTTLEAGEQVIIFQNRRGFAPMIKCNTCGYTPHCKNCDVNLTLHRYFDELRCHYCGYRTKNVITCPECGADDIADIGAGTERIEAELKIFFSDYKVARLDWDTAKSKTGFEKLLYDFAKGEYNILVGTQMVTKGFDFELVTLVCVVSGDNLLMYPDFRASERAFQTIIQVAGRAGRREKQGKVLIQAFRMENPVYADIISYNGDRFVNRELREREQLIFPPFCRMIQLTLKHRDVNVLEQGATTLVKLLYDKLGERVGPPVTPGISRIKNMYIKIITIKIEQNGNVIKIAKNAILWAKAELYNKYGIKTLRINIDVDPY